MNVPRSKLVALAVGLAAASPAFGYTLTVAPRGSGGGSGTVVDELVAGVGTTSVTTPRLNCAFGATCSVAAPNAPADPVLLRATPSATSAFAGWSGCPVTGQLTTYQGLDGFFCLLQAGTSNRGVTANFKAGQYTVTVKPGATADVAVAGQRTGVSPCVTGATCTYVFDPNALATVSVDPAFAVSAFTATPCKNTNTCVFSVKSNVTVSPVYAPAVRKFEVIAKLVDNGDPTELTGTGLAMDATDATSTLYSADVLAGASYTVTATAIPAGKSVKWSGCSTFDATTCTLTNITGARFVTAMVQSGVTSCRACHENPPSSHGPNAAALDCNACHAGASMTSAPTSGHNNGLVGSEPLPLPSSDGFNVQIQSATLAAGANPVIRAKFTDNAGNPLNMAQYYSQYQFRRYWAATNNEACAPNSNPCSSGDTRTYITQPRIGIIRLNADLTVNQMLVSALTSATASSTETLNVNGSQFVEVGTGTGVYDITLATFMPDTTNEASTALNRRTAFNTADTYRIAFIGGRWSSLHKADGMFVSAGNATFDIRPDGGAKVSHEIVTDAACKGCHGNFKLNFHANIRVGAQTCKVCHYDGYVANGVDPLRDMGYQNFVHRLHGGLDMYSGASNQGPFANRFYWDGALNAGAFVREKIKMAPSHQLYFEGGGSAIPPAQGADPINPALAVIDPELTIDCSTCHRGADANVAYTRPSKKACGSCHSVDWTYGTKWLDPIALTSVYIHHDGIDDAECAGCHAPSGVLDMSYPTLKAPIANVHGKFFEPAHQFDFRQLPDWPANGYDFQVKLVSVSAAANGAPTFVVDMFLNGQPFDPKFSLTTAVAAGNTVDQFGGRLATCAFQVAGPTTDYTVPATGGTAQSCTTAASWSKSGTQPGRYAYTRGTFFADKVDGYYTVSFEIMWQRVAQASNGDWIRKPFSANPNFLTVKKVGTAVTVVTDPIEVAFRSRRQVVDFDKCNTCHQDIGFHSNRGRKGPDYCATCHNPKLDNGTRARFTVAEAMLDPTGFSSTVKVFLPESVSMNVFIHRIHMGEELPSVMDPANASSWVTPGTIAYGATRSAFVGLDAATPPDVTDLSHFLMPNPMVRCDQCHISTGAKQTWGLPESGGLAPIERSYRTCEPTTPTWASEEWCFVGSTGGAPLVSSVAEGNTPVTVKTPPMKGVCMSCHDSKHADAHADAFTTNPMYQGGVAEEHCAGCHGAGRGLDAIKVHQKFP